MAEYDPTDRHECDARHDIHPDGMLSCTREAGHPGMHRGLVWWMEKAPALIEEHSA